MKRIKKSSFWGGDRYFCADCHKKVGYLDGFCGYCGMPIEWEKCPHCGHISETMAGSFCRGCGVMPVRSK